MSDMTVEDYLLYKGDEIDNAAYSLAIALLRTSPEQSSEEILPWDMAVIAAMIEGAIEALAEAGKETCWPYYEDEIPCSRTKHCKNANCPHECAEMDDVPLTKEE